MRYDPPPPLPPVGPVVRLGAWGPSIDVGGLLVDVVHQRIAVAAGAALPPEDEERVAERECSLLVGADAVRIVRSPADAARALAHAMVDEAREIWAGLALSDDGTIVSIAWSLGYRSRVILDLDAIRDWLREAGARAWISAHCHHVGVTPSPDDVQLDRDLRSIEGVELVDSVIVRGRAVETEGRLQCYSTRYGRFSIAVEPWPEQAGVGSAITIERIVIEREPLDWIERRAAAEGRTGR